MHAAAGFMADLMGFQARGVIGVTAEILLDPPQPEIGAPVQVSCLGVERGVLRASDGRQWQVQDGTRLHLPARALTLALYDAEGRVAAQLRIVPTVVVPTLLGWGLPKRPDYASGLLQLALQTAEATEATLWWRVWTPDGSAAWQALPGAAGEIVLAPRPATLELRALLRSRHGGLDPAATTEHHTTVAVAHPAPDWALAGPAGVPRHGQATLQLRARFVRSALLRAGGEARSCAGAAAHSASAPPLVLPTGVLGAQAVEVEIEALDGQVSLHHASVQVLPRPASCDWLTLPDGRVAYTLQAAEPLALLIPGLGQRLPLPGASGLIVHGCSFATRAELEFVDDTGEVCRTDLTLCLPTLGWPDLPALPALGWA